VITEKPSLLESKCNEKQTVHVKSSNIILNWGLIRAGVLFQARNGAPRSKLILRQIKKSHNYGRPRIRVLQRCRVTSFRIKSVEGVRDSYANVNECVPAGRLLHDGKGSLYSQLFERARMFPFPSVSKACFILLGWHARVQSWNGSHLKFVVWEISSRNFY
jgi:hypothetical protein